MNKITATKYVLAITLFTGTFNKPAVASSRKPYDKQMQNAFFQTVYKSYPKEKAASIIASQLDINTYPTDPDWTYFPMLTEAELDAIDHKEAIRIQGFEKLAEFSPEEIAAILKEAEADSSNPPLIYAQIPQKMDLVTSIEGAAKTASRSQSSSALKKQFTCPQCHQLCSRRDSLRRHIETKHAMTVIEAKEASYTPNHRGPNTLKSPFKCLLCNKHYANNNSFTTHILKHHCAGGATTKDDADEYSPIPTHPKNKHFVCTYCNAPVTRSECVYHITRACPVLHKQKNEEPNEKKQ
jgi:hypothetical protein